jgi:hypothetical protein
VDKRINIKPIAFYLNYFNIPNRFTNISNGDKGLLALLLYFLFLLQATVVAAVCSRTTELPTLVALLLAALLSNKSSA